MVGSGDGVSGIVAKVCRKVDMGFLGGLETGWTINWGNLEFRSDGGSDGLEEVEVAGAVVEVDGGYMTTGGWVGFIWGFGKGSFGGNGLFGGGRKADELPKKLELDSPNIEVGFKGKG